MNTPVKTAIFVMIYIKNEKKTKSKTEGYKIF